MLRQQLRVQDRAALGRRHDHHDRQVLLDQRDRAVLELAGREALGVHVGELLELERALQGHREADVAAEEQHRLRRRELAGQRAGRLDDRLQHARHRVGARLELGVLAGDLVGVLRAERLRQRQPDQVAGDDLRGERLRRRDTDLGAGVGVEHRVGLAGDLRAVGVADRQHAGLLLAGVAHGLQRVGGLARLGDRDDERGAVEHGVAVAELAGHLDLDRDAAPVLDRVLREQARVVRRAAGDDEHLVDVAQLLVGEALLVEHDPAVDEVPAQRVGQRRRLLLDLLQHEEVVAALLGGGDVPVDVERAGLGGVAVEVGDDRAVAGQRDDLVLAELDRLAGVVDERGDVGGDEHLALADADHQRRGAPGGDDLVGPVGVGEHQRERALEPRHDGAHGAREPARPGRPRTPARPGGRRPRCRCRWPARRPRPRARRAARRSSR